MSLQDIYKKAGVVMKPAAMKDGKLYSQQPHSGAGDFNFSRADGVQTRINKHGLIETVDNNVPRLSYDLVDGKVSDCPHLLLEPQRTNSLTYSGDFSEWSITGTVTSGQTGFDGSNNAFLFEQSGNAALAIQSNTTSGVQTLSVFAKGNVQNGLRMYAFGSSNVFTYFDLNLGVVESTSNTISNSIEDYGDGWYRCSMTFDQTNTNLYFYLSNNQNSNENTGSILLQYAQLENGSYATSYIPTSGSAENREAEESLASGNSDIFHSDSSVFFVDFERIGQETASFMTIDNSSGFELIRLHFDSASVRFRNSAESYATIGDSITSPLGQRLKLALKIDGSILKVFADGSQVGSNYSRTAELPFNSVDFFAKAVKLFEFSHIQEALTDEELITLTTP